MKLAFESGKPKQNNIKKMMGSFPIDGTNTNDQDYVLHLTIPDSALNNIVQNPNDLSLKFLSDPLSNEVVSIVMEYFLIIIV